VEQFEISVLADINLSQSLFLDKMILAYVSTKGIANAPGSFAALESKVGSLKGRKFFGYYNPETEEYRACVALTDADKDDSFGGLAKWTVAAGNYVYEKLEKWNDNKNRIGPTIEKLIRDNSGQFDPSRPVLEYYKTMDELRLLVPIR
jgi:hypothetical protein